MARIWLAAHWDKKLTKAHVYETNIESSVEGIMQPKVKMALRTSGHLLLGVVRIYSRKAKYLLADCNEAFVKIKMAFRPGMVDLPEDKREAAMNAITLPDVFHDFDTAMPDLDDVDIDAQFTLNQTRAEEITMREDYGNITLTTGDDGFGDSMEQMEMEEPRSPEMLRDASHAEHFGSIGGEDINLDEESAKLREMSTMEPSTSSGLPATPRNEEPMDAPIQDDGFGGVGLVQDILSGGLFEGGSLFDDPVPGGADSIRIPPSERTGFDDDEFPGIPSPIHSDGSRPGTPATEDLSLAGDSAPPAPELEQTPVPPSPAHSMHSNHSIHSIHSIRSTRSMQGEQAPVHEQTTLLHNEEESFALAPVEASALKGERRKRKRKLIVDDIKAITGEGMKAQLSDSADIVTTLDIAPPTKRLMHWKETGGVEELFSLPGRRIRARIIISDYQNNLKHKTSEDELFDTLPGNAHYDDIELEYVGGDQDEDYEERVEKPKKRAPKRKIQEPAEKSAYAKRQEELAQQQEQFAEQQKNLREEQQKKQKQQKEQNQQEPEEEQQEQEKLREIPTEQADISLPQPAGWGENYSTNAPEGYQTPGYEQAGQSFGQVGYATPAHSAFGAPSMGYPTPVHEPSYATPTHQPSGFPSNEQTLPVDYPAPGLPASNLTPGDQASFTEQWVNQVQTNPSMMSPPHQTPIMSPPHHPNLLPHHQEEPLMSPQHHEQVQPLAPVSEEPPIVESPEKLSVNNEPILQNGEIHNEEAEIEEKDEHEFEEEEEAEEEEEDEYAQEYQKEKVGEEDDDMQEDETIEEFEDRVLNKRAAHLHRLLTRKFADRMSQMTKRNNRKQVAQKFHSLLVLQKMMAVEMTQDSEPPYGDIRIQKGPAFTKAGKSL